MSSEDGYGWRLLRFWFPDWATFGWFFLGLLPALFFQTVIHEGWHAVFAGFKVDTFAPFPHCKVGGGIRNGVTFYERGVDAFPAAPQIMELVMILGVFFLIFFWAWEIRWLRYIVRLWFFALCVDFGFNTFAQLWGNKPDGTDWTRFQDDLGWGAAGMGVFTWVLWIVFILSHFVWVNWARWYESRPPAANFFSYKWMAVPLFVLSLLAIILMLAVDHPQVIKEGCWWYISVLVGQFVMAVWYVVFFIWCWVREAD